MNWTQPLCRSCWGKREPGRQPTQAINADQESCCMCKAATTDGIYVRIDPRTVPFPASD